ncbi:adenylyl-sulfate kinase [Buchnera aphidicola]|uniref:adenylyl-sulfate kinase n=1 Tax=Buchnera aphidicola TaxID=9 RepID=UPI00346450AF
MNNNKKNDIFWKQYDITRIHREKNHNHKSIVIWFTGLSGSGKSTIANAVETFLFRHGISTYLLDGDNVRSGLCSDLSFSTSDRKENIRRIGEVTKIILDTGIIVLVSIISPYEYDRNMVYQLLGRKNVVEVYVDTPLSICEKRDTKGLYKKARSGKISNFTGLQLAYEIPQQPDLHLNGTLILESNVKKIIQMLHNRNFISLNLN